VVAVVGAAEVAADAAAEEDVVDKQTFD